jgi:DNA-binding beta-propeller fold protein YncE
MHVAVWAERRLRNFVWAAVLLACSALVIGGCGLAGLNVGVVVTTPDAIARIYVTSIQTDEVVRAYLDGSSPERFDLGGVLNEPRGLVVDGQGRRVVVASMVTSRLSWAQCDGTAPEDLGNPGGLIQKPYAMAFEPSARKLYIPNTAGNHHIIRANLDGSDPEDLGDLNGLLDIPAGIAFDEVTHRMYVVSRGDGRIIRANYDGRNPQLVVDLSGVLDAAYGIAIDPVRRTMYVVGHNSDNVIRANLDGSGVEDLGNPGGLLAWPRFIALDLSRGHMYISNMGGPGGMYDGRIIRADLDGSNPVDLGDLDGKVQDAGDIALGP